MLKIDMFSTADSVKGQGVGSVYDELMNLLRDHFADQLQVEVNRYDRADVSQYHTINLPFYFSTFSKKRGRKVGMVHFLPETLDQSLKLPKLFKWFFYHYVINFYRRMDQLVVVNPAFIPKLVAYGIPRQRITYVPNFVNHREFHPASREYKLKLRRKYGYDDRQFIILGSGQVQTRKGVMDFIRLARLNPEIQFIWVGGFSFGKLTAGYSQLKTMVEHPPVNLAFPGIVDRKAMGSYYQLADLFLLPSYNELFPMSALEAFNCGIPVVLRDLSLYRVIFGHNYATFNSLSNLNQVVHELVNQSSLLADLRRKSLVVAKRYSSARLAKIWLAFYQNQAKRGEKCQEKMSFR